MRTKSGFGCEQGIIKDKTAVRGEKLKKILT